MNKTHTLRDYVYVFDNNFNNVKKQQNQKIRISKRLEKRPHSYCILAQGVSSAQREHWFALSAIARGHHMMGGHFVVDFASRLWAIIFPWSQISVQTLYPHKSPSDNIINRGPECIRMQKDHICLLKADFETPNHPACTTPLQLAFLRASSLN